MMTEQGDKKPGRYSVRLEVFSYSPERLLRLAGVGLAGALVFGVLAVLIPDELQQKQFIGAACSWLGLFISSIGAWLYKRKTWEGDQQPTAKRTRLFLSGTVGLVTFGAVVGIWSFLHFQGLSTESISDLFGKSGTAVLVSCLAALAILKVHNRVNRY